MQWSIMIFYSFIFVLGFPQKDADEKHSIPMLTSRI